MRNLIYKIIPVFALLVLGISIGIILFNRQPEVQQIQSNANTLTFESNTQLSIEIEIAETEQEKSQGLMYRTKLGENNGMLFIYDQEQALSFWMKNTYIPLDIIFIDGEGKINTIHSNTKTNQTQEIYHSSLPSKYVLETNGNFCEKNNIRVGDRVIFSKTTQSLI